MFEYLLKKNLYIECQSKEDRIKILDLKLFCVLDLLMGGTFCHCFRSLALTGTGAFKKFWS